MKRPERVAFWLSLARRDLLKARRLAEDPILTDGVCFHAEQAAEKAVKGWLCHVGVQRIRKIHDMVLLVAVAPAGAESPFDERVLSVLSGYAIGPRYSEKPPPVERARQALAWAEGIVEKVAALVEPPLPDRDDAGRLGS